MNVSNINNYFIQDFEHTNTFSWLGWRDEVAQTINVFMGALRYKKHCTKNEVFN